ncbi:deoxyribose-phosphate aldolase [Flexithrix dorotheae]|uniref:deoxyribose-phosphate aldolase n=1 Tax=Flexithrix dorotheae TaxID=70993 RepID=UPI0003789C89|nr:deoxyribose-phosphate aldolase [Flexithrix dorotheae]
MVTLNQYIEHTNLKPTATQADIEKLLEEAIQYQFLGVCVPPYWVKKVKRDIGQNEIRLVTVAGFPLGYNMSQTKLAEISRAIEEGADEIDVVMNLSAFKSDAKGWAKVEVAQFAKLSHQHDVLLKMILETAYLSDEEIVTACKFCKDAGADFVKTSTGFGPFGATPEHVKLMKDTVGETVGVKASGGIKTLDQVKILIASGAERIGTSSGVEIVKNQR